MADETELGRRLAGLAESGQGHVVPLAAHQVRARGERRTRRRRAAAAGGVALLACALVAGGLTLAASPRGPEPATAGPAPVAPPFTPPSPAPDEEYAGELGRVYGAVAQGDFVRVTVQQLRAAPGGAEPTGVVHTLTLPGATLVETRLLSGGHRADLRLSELVGRLAGGPRWTFEIDYDGEGRVESLREAEA
ncbi:hypothetical protein ABZ883_11080 [Streptomyces sp. NPDC046977]|uniref:hypothetical protein n=1 Tax=Streptomyces sp. NPDC046977 TaxID=3154703 RepID=UPI0033DD1B0D